ncbi:condensation domain-containing protein [Pyxidicoccus sp. 3LG]
MIPSALVQLPALPLNANGKVDRKALPAPEAPSSSEGGVAPRNELEAKIAAIWADVLHRESVGIHDDFFALGGHSLLATQVVSRLRSALDVELPLSELFSAPTVAGIAARVGAAKGKRAPALVRAQRTGDLPLSFAQQRLWFIDQLQPGNSLYNVPLILKLEGRLDEMAMQRAFDELVRRHEALRTLFRTEAGKPVQEILPSLFVPLQRVDLSKVDEEDLRRAEAVRLTMEEARRPFDLLRGPMIRILLLKLGAREFVLVVHLHHIVSDGWSMGVLVRELTALYEAFRRDLPSPLPELPLQYADYAIWQRSWLQGETLEAQLGWWKARLDGVPFALDIPTDKPRPPVFGNKGATLAVRLPLGLTQKLEALAQREAVTPFMLLLSVFQTLLHRYSGQDDLLVGSPIANRDQGATEGLIGFFVNTLVLRARFTPALTFRELLAQVKEMTLGAYEHQAVPFEKLVEELQPSRDASRSPLFQAMFAVQNAPVPELVLPELTVGKADAEDSGVALFELSLDLFRPPEGFVGVLNYSTELFEASTATRMLQHFRMLLEGVLARPDATVLELPMAVTPGVRFPFIGTFATTLPLPALRVAWRACRKDTFFNFELHGVDVLDASDGIPPELVRQQRDLRVSAASKLERLREVFGWLKAECDVITLRDSAGRLAGTL